MNSADKPRVRQSFHRLFLLCSALSDTLEDQRAVEIFAGADKGKARPIVSIGSDSIVLRKYFKHFLMSF